MNDDQLKRILMDYMPARTLGLKTDPSSPPTGKSKDKDKEAIQEP